MYEGAAHLVLDRSAQSQSDSIAAAWSGTAEEIGAETGSVHSPGRGLGRLESFPALHDQTIANNLSLGGARWGMHRAESPRLLRRDSGLR